jgi:hypothetical protein
VDALTEALNTNNTTTIVAVIEDMACRGGLETALSKGNESLLRNLLGFIYKKCDSAEHQQLIFTLLDLVTNELSGLLEKLDDSDAISAKDRRQIGSGRRNGQTGFGARWIA